MGFEKREILSMAREILDMNFFEDVGPSSASSRSNRSAPGWEIHNHVAEQEKKSSE